MRVLCSNPASALQESAEARFVAPGILSGGLTPQNGVEMGDIHYTQSCCS